MDFFRWAYFCFIKYIDLQHIKQNIATKFFFVFNASHYILYPEFLKRKSELNEHMRFLANIILFLLILHIIQGIVYIIRTLTFTFKKHELLNFWFFFSFNEAFILFFFLLWDNNFFLSNLFNCFLHWAGLDGYFFVDSRSF